MKITKFIRGDDPQGPLAAFVAERPPEVFALAQDFPLGSVIETQDHTVFYVIGWTEDDRLILSRLDPFNAAHKSGMWDKMVNDRTYICARHVRDFLSPQT